MSRKPAPAGLRTRPARPGRAAHPAGNLWRGWGSNGALETEPVDVGGRKVYALRGKSEDLDGVRVFNPQGKPIALIRLAERCANLCFGGPTNNRLYMASRVRWARRRAEGLDRFAECGARVLAQRRHQRPVPKPVHQQAAVLRAMPLDNATRITGDERAPIKRWLEPGAARRSVARAGSRSRSRSRVAATIHRIGRSTQACKRRGIIAMDLPAHQLTMTVLMTPDMANFAGNVHGVAVDDERRPVAVAPLHPGTPDERQRHAAAEVRKQLRAEFAQRHAALRRAAL